MRLRTSNRWIASFLFVAAITFFSSVLCYQGNTCAYQSENYSPIFGAGFSFLYIAVLPRFATVIFNFALPFRGSIGRLKRLDNWLVIDELKKQI
jgi:TRAP-type C4-dicarboxylate transport system permease small subunit